MTNIKLGEIITDKQDRDAVHIAIAPVTAEEKLYPGQEVGITNKDKNIAGTKGEKVGIVDPFLKSVVFPEQKFWLFLYPNTIKNLRHEWSHPQFSNAGTLLESIAISWLSDFANQADLSYNELLEAARDYVETGSYICEGGKWEGFYTPDEFWIHYEIVTGEAIPEDKRGNFFTCSC